MVQCIQYYAAEDQNNTPMPGTVYADLQSWNGSFWESIGNLVIPNTFPPESTSLQEGDRFRVAPMPVTGYATPSEIEFTACGNDVILVYKKKICTPYNKKCVGDDVYVCNSAGTEWIFSENCPGGCSGGECIEVPVDNGFTIRVSTALATKNVLVAHVVKMPFIGLVGPDPDLWYWPQAFDYVGGEWYMTDPATTYRVEVGSIFETIPSFNKTYGTGSFADGIHCVVLAEGDSGVNTLIFKGEDVFQLFANSPTEINLSSVSNDVISEALMGPVCDFFSIPRGSECNSFWAEFYDPVYVANYVSILRTGKDTLGNDRELHTFDHIALPFAILGSLPGLSLLPFGAIVTNGLEAVAKTGAKFGDEAIKFMLDFSMDSIGHISTKEVWSFTDAFRRTNGEHATQIAEYLASGNIKDAETVLRRFAGECTEWYALKNLDDIVKSGNINSIHKWFRDHIGFSEIGATVVTNTAKQATLSADDIAKLADAAKDSGVMDEVGDAIFNSVKTGDNVDDLNNIIKNMPEAAKELAERLHSAIYSGSSEVNTIAKNIVELDGKNFKAVYDNISDKPSIVNTLLYGSSEEKALAYAMKSVGNGYPIIEAAKGAAKADEFAESVVGISRKAHTTADPGKMAAIPSAVQDYATSYADVATDMGGTIADDIVATTDEFVVKPTSDWLATGKQTVKNTSDKFWNYFNGLSDAAKENIVHAMVAATLVFAAVILYKIYTDAGPQSLNHGLFTSKMDSLYWPCYHACEDERADDLDAAIKLYESTINDCAKSLYDHKTSLEADGTYEEFSKTLQIHRFNLSRMKSCLENLQPCGNIHCTSNEDFFYVDLDGQPAGFSYANREILLTAVKTGSHTVKIHKHGYTPECTESVNVTEGTIKTVDCQMVGTGDCSPVTDVKIYIDPLSPVADEVVSFNGSASSNDPITSWEWTFGDGFTATGQAVTHPYSSKGIYTVKLVVTNDCGLSESTTRNVTVSEEEQPVESTTLQIQTPIGTDGTEIPRYWEIEIWVDGKDTACNPPKTLTFGTNVFCDCTSPWNLVPCELGQHTITLKKYGYDDKTMSVYMEKDIPKTWYSPVMVKTTTPPPVRTVYIEVPVGSMLYVDGGSVGGTSISRLTTIYDEMRKR